VKQVEHATLTVSLPNGKKEDYLITFPHLGPPYVELAERSYIQSSTGWLSTIKYQGKGYFSGKSHTFKVDLTPPIGAGSGFQASSFEGQWNTTSKDTRIGAVFTDLTGPKEEVTVRQVEEHGDGRVELCGTKLQRGPGRATLKRLRGKSRIEVCISPILVLRSVAYCDEQNEQRQRRRDEEAAGTSWDLKHFVQPGRQSTL
jgi:hypothetical protein